MPSQSSSPSPLPSPSPPLSLSPSPPPSPPLSPSLSPPQSFQRPPSAHSTFKDDIPLINYSKPVVKETVRASLSKHSPYLDFKGHNVNVQSLFSIWWLEISCCIISVIMLITIASLLFPYQGRPLPKLPYHISTNAFLAVLITVMKASVLLTLAQGIGQLKWDHFRKRRPLTHLGIYDSASRGPWGCIQLILTLNKHDMVASIGALLTVFAIAMEPFTQQMVQYYPCAVDVVNGSVALVPRASFYAETGPHLGLIAGSATVEQVSAVVGSIFSPGAVKVPVTCLTGRCSFDEPYASLAYCAKCEDISHEIRDNITVQYTSVDNSTYRVSANDTADIPGVTPATSQRVTLLNYRSSLASGLMVSLDDQTTFRMAATSMINDTSGILVETIFRLPPQNSTKTGSPTNFRYPDRPVVKCDKPWHDKTWGCMEKGAARCTISPCVKTYSASVEAGILDERVVHVYDRWHIHKPLGSIEQIVMADLNCTDQHGKDALKRLGYEIPTSRFMPYQMFVDKASGNHYYTGSVRITSENSESLSVIPAQCIYAMDSVGTQAIQKLLTNYFTFNVTFDSTGFSGSDQALRILNHTYFNFDDIDRTFQTLAEGLTSEVRQWDWNSTKLFSTPASGATQLTDTCIRVRWSWILYPAAVTALTVIFSAMVLASTTVTDEKGFARSWKNSPLPLVFHGFDRMQTQFAEDQRILIDIRDMERVAGTTTGYIAYRSIMDRPPQF